MLNHRLSRLSENNQGGASVLTGLLGMVSKLHAGPEHVNGLILAALEICSCAIAQALT